MKQIYIAENANKIVKTYLTEKGYVLKEVSSSGLTDPAIACHPDVFYCRLGITDDAPVMAAGAGEVSPGYPNETAFNAACTGRYFIHNLKMTHPRLLESAKAAGMELIHVSQGYAKCSTVIVDEQSIITYDRGIAGACKDLDVLLVTPGHVLLPGHNTGFIGGCSGRIGKEIIFNGDLSAHPDSQQIRAFIEGRGLTCTWFKDYPLTDIGSIV